MKEPLHFLFKPENLYDGDTFEVASGAISKAES